MARIVRQLDDEALEKPFNSKQFFRLLVYMRPYTKQIIGSLILMVLAMACSLASPYLMSRAIDELEKTTLDMLPWLLGGMAVVALVAWLRNPYKGNRAEVAVNTICGHRDTMLYNAIPGIVYTNPEVAGVGITEAQAKQQSIEYQCHKLPLDYSGRFVAENEGGEGVCKVITDKTSGRVLGVHMLGNPCSEIISSACIAIERGMTAKELERVVFPHPTVGEIIKETILM